MTLRDQFGINGNHKKLTGKCSDKYQKGSGDTGKVLNFIGNVSMKELCQGIVN
jgi:hypothetical protein